MPQVELRDVVTEEDRAALLGLRPGPGKDEFVSLPADSFAEADEHPQALPRIWAVHDAGSGALVGMTMISDGIPEPIDDDLIGPYFLWKLLIDERHQRHGYGRATIDAVVGYVAGRPRADVLFTSCGRGEGSPYPFYLGYGFTDTGTEKWGETVLELDLAGRRGG